MEIYTGKTIEEALQKASEELNKPVSDLIYIDTGKNQDFSLRKFKLKFMN